MVSVINGYAQTGSVKGSAFDCASMQHVANATVTVLQVKDSSLVSFTMTDNIGRFEITSIPAGRYRLLITHVNYHNIAIPFTIDEQHKMHDMGSITLYDKNKMLTEVVVEAEAPPVTMSGDTVIYNAGSFKTQPNASVEDLLKKMPGIKVEKDGTIKAQGDKVKKVLVDGKEFFGNDPKVATKNLPADAIDKVQVYDKMSDQAQLTGIDDGNSERTINLKLKKDKKKGMFGKIKGAYGTDDRYQGSANLNSFKGARQFSVIGTANNTNAEGFSFMDILNFTGALNQQRSSGGDIQINIADDDPLAGLLGGNSIGINTTAGGGMNYNNIIGTKTDLQSNYFFSSYNPYRESHIQRQYFVPANIYTENSVSQNNNDNHRLNFMADYQIDSFNSLKLTPSLTYQNSRMSKTSQYQTANPNGTLTNDGTSAYNSGSDGYNFGGSLLYRRRFHKKGRTLSFNLSGTANNSNGDDRLSSLINFYDSTGTPFLRDSISQISNRHADQKGYNARLVYTEPIFKKYLLELSAGNDHLKDIADKNTYDYNPVSGRYDLLDNPLTNKYQNDYDNKTVGIRIRRQTRKYNYAVGFSWHTADLEGKANSEIKDSLISRQFSDLLPNARFQYRFSQFKSVTFLYSTATNPPTIAQLQPLADNSNPLYVKLGNPSLQEEYSHTMRMNVNWVNPFKNRNVFATLTYQQVQNKIVNYDQINSLGVDSVRLVNVNGTSNMNASLTYEFPVKKLKATITTGGRVGYTKGEQFINSLANNIRTVTLAPELGIDINPTEKLNVSLNADVNFYKASYSIASASNTYYVTQDYSADVNLQLPKKFYVSTNFNYIINTNRGQGFNNAVPLWNASLSKQLLKYNRGEIKFSVNDILDMNVGVNRTANQNYIEDSRVNGLRRFFMLGFTYSLSKMGLNSTNSSGGTILR